MKKATILVLALLLALCGAVFGNCEEGLPLDFREALQALYEANEAQILSASACGTAGAAVVQSGSGCFLAVLSRSGGEWQKIFENTKAVCEKSRVYLDTDEMLILDDPFDWNDQDLDQFYFVFNGDEWVLSSAIRYENSPDEFDVLTEYHAGFANGWLTTEVYSTDMEGNVLSSRINGKLPDVLTDDERLLSAFDGFAPPINGLGYPTDESMQVSDTILSRLFSTIVPAEFTYVDGLKTADGLQFIADKQGGTCVLLCCAYAGEQIGWQITESTPLPVGTRFGIENFTDTLNLGLHGFGVSIGRKKRRRVGRKRHVD